VSKIVSTILARRAGVRVGVERDSVALGCSGAAGGKECGSWEGSVVSESVLVLWESVI